MYDMNVGYGIAPKKNKKKIWKALEEETQIYGIIYSIVYEMFNNIM